MPEYANDPAELWRIVNAFGCVSVLVLIAVYVSERWDAWTEEARLLTHALGLALLAVLVDTVENLVQGNPVGARTGANSIAVSYTFLCFWVIRRADRRRYGR